MGGKPKAESPEKPPKKKKMTLEEQHALFGPASPGYSCVYVKASARTAIVEVEWSRDAAVA